MTSLNKLITIPNTCYRFERDDPTWSYVERILVGLYILHVGYSICQEILAKGNLGDVCFARKKIRSMNNITGYTNNLNPIPTEIPVFSFTNITPSRPSFATSATDYSFPS